MITLLLLLIQVQSFNLSTRFKVQFKGYTKFHHNYCLLILTTNRLHVMLNTNGLWLYPKSIYLWIVLLWLMNSNNIIRWRLAWLDFVTVTTNCRLYFYRALARDCYAPLDNKNGAESKEWKKGKPIRVVRNCKGAKHSKYAPTEGNRYDGIYKVLKMCWMFSSANCFHY